MMDRDLEDLKDLDSQIPDSEIDPELEPLS